ncbi:MAG: toxin-antitoxin system HicB family antitoxin [Holophagales bacterium]|nr:toxin-antitoxin system HicB family antitoxin [Holophagales bacterium]MYF94202.1 toxin-antitoxin system HicB family antitoxin [Holophagales bacterium]
MATLSNSQSSQPAKSGRFLLRMPAALHATLHGAARSAGLSLNEYCVRRLASGGSRHPEAAALVNQAVAVAGDRLRAVVLHGSVVRGEAAAGSDLDVLVVVDRGVRLNRGLYKAWDAGSPASPGQRPVDPHFVHSPAEDSMSGLWAEAAIAGEVLFDHDGGTSAHLARMRREIAEGRLCRRIVHGQPYWTAA